MGHYRRWLAFFFSVVLAGSLPGSILIQPFVIEATEISPGLFSPENFVQEARLSTEIPGNNIGSRVVLSGNIAVLGSSDGALVYVRSGTTWSQPSLLVPNDGLSTFIGSPVVETDGETILLGGPVATINGSSVGAVYVFVRNGATWTEQQRLTASDGAANDNFGGTISISGDTLMIGSPGNDVGPNVDQGSVYVFARNGGMWSEQTIILANDGGARNAFGRTVKIDGDTAVFGKSRNPFATVIDPAVYIFVRNGTTWQQQQRLSVCEPSASGECAFGRRFAIKGDTLAIGNWFLNSGASTAVGGVYIFTRTSGSWTQQQKLLPDVIATNSEYGSSLSIDNGTLAVGAVSDIGGPGAGSVYLYTRPANDWVQQQKLQVPNVTYWNAFGSDVSLSGNSLLVGCQLDNGVTPFIGAGYVYTQSSTAVIRSLFDFDGDGKTDSSIFRPGPGEWWWLRSSNGGNGAVQFGASTDTVAAADYTGDGKTDVAFFRPGTGFWYILRSEDFSFYAFPFGGSGDIPAPGDFDGDGKADATVFRPSTATWYILNSGGGTTITQFGAVGDVPVTADYDGDGKSDVGIFRPSVGQWWIQRSTAGLLAVQFGAAGDRMVPGDYTGDGKADIAYFHPATGFWNVLRSEDLSFYGFPFGTSTDIPTPGDYDGDGKFDAAIFRPTTATWYANNSGGGTLIQQFGAAGDIPVPNAYVR